MVNTNRERVTLQVPAPDQVTSFAHLALQYEDLYKNTLENRFGRTNQTLIHVQYGTLLSQESDRLLMYPLSDGKEADVFIQKLQSLTLPLLESTCNIIELYLDSLAAGDAQNLLAGPKSLLTNITNDLNEEKIASVAAQLALLTRLFAEIHKTISELLLSDGDAVDNYQLIELQIIILVMEWQKQVREYASVSTTSTAA